MIINLLNIKFYFFSEFNNKNFINQTNKFLNKTKNNLLN